MILSDTTIQSIDADLLLRQKLGMGLGFTDDWIRRLAKANKPNGPLTTVKAVSIIREETKMQDEEILVDEEALATSSKT